jgi:hypothetical protein
VVDVDRHHEDGRVSFSAADVGQLEDRGISVAEARRQLEQLSSPAHYLELVRPCTVGDGIVRLGPDDVDELHALHAEAVRPGRFTKFVPGSGAASRMFRSLSYYRRGAGFGTAWQVVVGHARDGRSEAAELVTFIEQLRSFAFYDDLKECLRARGRDLDALAAAGEFEPILDALFAPDGLDYERLPKGLLAFHRYAGESRTAFEEHLVEAVRYTRDGNGVCRLHYTVTPGHLPLCEATARRALERGITGDARLEIGYSTQKPSTDTLSLDASGSPLRDDAGQLQFRPGGHGALIENLNELEADLVFIKNIDNVRPDDADSVTSSWKRALAGCLVRLQRETFGYLERLSEGEPRPALLERARAFVRERLGADLERDTGRAAPRDAGASLVSRLNRPLRVCGVVPNTGEPGGGPFWVRGADGRVSKQIVEGGQVDPRDARQQEILRASTHFNPVDLVCAVRDHRGRSFDLTRYVDPEAVIVARKSDAGRELWALERPGLWNGAMAGWNTIFVEVPIETFTPVKTVIDLLRDEHLTA